MRYKVLAPPVIDRRVVCIAFAVRRRVSHITQFGSDEWAPAWVADKRAIRAKVPRYFHERRCLCVGETLAVSPTSHNWERELNVIVLPATDRADVIAARWVAENEEAAARARILSGAELALFKMYALAVHAIE